MACEQVYCGGRNSDVEIPVRERSVWLSLVALCGHSDKACEVEKNLLVVRAKVRETRAGSCCHEHPKKDQT